MIKCASCDKDFEPRYDWAKTCFDCYKREKAAKEAGLPFADSVPKQAAQTASKPFYEKSKAPEDRNRSFALSYAKDLAAAGVIPPSEVIAYADDYLKWLSK